MLLAFRLFFFATALAVVAVAVAARGLVQTPEARTRIGEVPSVARPLLQQAMAPPTDFDRAAVAQALRPADGPVRLRAALRPDAEGPAAAASPEEPRDADSAAADRAVAEAESLSAPPALAFAAEPDAARKAAGEGPAGERAAATGRGGPPDQVEYEMRPSVTAAAAAPGPNVVAGGEKEPEASLPDRPKASATLESKGERKKAYKRKFADRFAAANARKKRIRMARKAREERRVERKAPPTAPGPTAAPAPAASSSTDQPGPGAAPASPLVSPSASSIAPQPATALP